MWISQRRSQRTVNNMASKTSSGKTYRLSFFMTGRKQGHIESAKFGRHKSRHLHVTLLVGIIEPIFRRPYSDLTFWTVFDPSFFLANYTCFLAQLSFVIFSFILVWKPQRVEIELVASMEQETNRNEWSSGEFTRYATSPTPPPRSPEFRLRLVTALYYCVLHIAILMKII